MIVSDLMSTKVSSVEADYPLSIAVALMRKNRYSCVLVKSNNGVPVGIITERDIVRVLDTIFNENSHRGLVVKDVMTPDPVCIQENTAIDDVWVMARTRQLRHFPVVNDDEKLIGILTQTDMVNAYLKLNENHKNLESENQELHLLSQEDGLLGIGNRRALKVDLAFTEASSRRYNRIYSVAVIDVDLFKQYNDEYGHQAGDELLQSVVQAIKHSMREADRLYRYGGDEFLLIMPETDTEGATTTAERLRLSVEEKAQPHPQSPRGIATISIGTASSNAGDRETLIKWADQALYDAKKAGRNKVCFINPNQT